MHHRRLARLNIAGLWIPENPLEETPLALEFFWQQRGGMEFENMFHKRRHLSGAFLPISLAVILGDRLTPLFWFSVMKSYLSRPFG
jgi:hypothetical protein